ncbi:dihydrofolate reductase family protein, partial [Enterobacter hormaechei]|uniref:dihydrofolate reductase family protein n=1 Tax=Enterobacter hormaechei TaxID=158836 RepID=UPI0019537126
HPWQLWGWGDDNAWDDELKRDFNAVFQTIDTILLSRKMAEEGYLTHWGNAARKFPEDPFYAFAQRIVEARKVVPSDRLKTSRWE